MNGFRAKLNILALIALTALGCKPNGELGVGGDARLGPPNVSNLSQVSQQRYECLTQDESTAKYIFKDAPSNFFSGWAPDEQLYVMQLMGNLPEEYIQHLFKANSQAGFQVIQEYLGPGTGGLTMLGYYSEWAKVAPGSIDWALNHELGHALHYYIDNESGGAIDNRLNNAYYTDRNNPNVGSYATTQLAEWFAESFQSFYCSPEAQDFIKQNIPDTYAVLSEALVPARWDSNSRPSDLFKILAYKEEANSNSYTNIGGNEYKFLVSAPEGIEKIAVCWSGVSECRDDASKQNIYELKETLSNGLKVYYNESSKFNLTGKNIISVIGVDTNEEKNVSTQFEINVAGGV